MAEQAPSDAAAGRGIVRTSWLATAALAISDLGAALGPKWLLVPGAIVAVALFLGGCGVFIGAWLVAAQRSYDVQHGVGLGGSVKLDASTILGDPKDDLLHGGHDDDLLLFSKAKAKGVKSFHHKH